MVFHLIGIGMSFNAENWSARRTKSCDCMTPAAVTRVTAAVFTAVFFRVFTGFLLCVGADVYLNTWRKIKKPRQQVQR